MATPAVIDTCGSGGGAIGAFTKQTKKCNIAACDLLWKSSIQFILNEMKDVFKLFLSIMGCELVGILGTPLTIAAIPTWYATLNKPSFAPPNWIFGPVWTLLYFLMGTAFYLIWKQGWEKKKVKTASWFFLAQLVLNFIWSPIFFGLREPLLGLVVIAVLWITIVTTMKKFYPLSRLAFYLLIPYLLWVSFATLLNTAIVILN